MRSIAATMKALAALLFVVATAAGAEPKVYPDLPYAEPKNELKILDVYAPAAGRNHPVVVWIHGGGWHSGDKKDVKQKPQAFTDKGFVFVSINYRLQVWTDPSLSPGVSIKQIAEDVAKAIHWAHDHAGDYGGDPNAIFVMGHSAGAQLAALVCTDDRYLKAENLSLAIIKGCVPVDGDTFDLPMRTATVHKRGDKKLADRDSKRFGDETMQKDLSSITYIAKGKRIPPFLILHADTENPDFRTSPSGPSAADAKGQSERLLQVLRQTRIPAMTYPAKGKNHTTINDDLGTQGDGATKAVFEFLDDVALANAPAEDNRKESKDKEKKAEFTGKLRTGIVAIGGETTGIIIETKKGAFELDFGEQKELRQKAEKLDGKNVTVVGKLEIRKGVEVKERRIVIVTSLEEAKEK